jgi:hypothetical protein
VETVGSATTALVHHEGVGVAIGKPWPPCLSLGHGEGPPGRSPGPGEAKPSVAPFFSIPSPPTLFSPLSSPQASRCSVGEANLLMFFVQSGMVVKGDDGDTSSLTDGDDKGRAAGGEPGCDGEGSVGG